MQFAALLHMLPPMSHLELLGLAGAGGLAVVSLAAGVWRRHRQQRQTHGSSRWATRREVAQAGLYTRAGVVLGRHRQQVIRAPADKHVLICGPSGSGKDVGHNFPTTLTYPGSMLILDVKESGENYALCHAQRARLGPVYRFAPGQRHSHAYNLLNGVRVGHPEEFRDVTSLVEGLMAPRKKGTRPTGNSVFFEQKGITTVRGVLLHVLTACAPAEHTLAQCRALMADPQPCLKAMQESTHPEVQAQGKRLADLYQQGEEQFAGEWGTAQSVLDLYGDPLIAHHTRQSDFKLTDLQYAPTPITLYLGAESPKDLLYLYPLFRAAIEQACRQLTGIPARYRRRRWPLLMLLNEFAELGYMPIVEQMLAVARSYGVQFLIAVQDLGQLFEVYGGQTPLWGNLGVKVFHTPDNEETAARITTLLGQETIEVESVQRGFGGRRSSHPGARALLDPAEILGLPETAVLIRARSCPYPIRATKVRYWQDRY